MTELHPLYQEALCTWQAFRLLGFGADDLYVEQEKKTGRLYVLVESVGFAWPVEPVGVDPCALRGQSLDDLRASWAETANVLNTSPEPEVVDHYRRSTVYARADDLVRNLVQRGILSPRDADC